MSDVTAAAAADPLGFRLCEITIFFFFAAQFLSDVLKIWNYTVQCHIKCMFQMCAATDGSSRSVLDHLVCSKGKC